MRSTQDRGPDFATVASTLVLGALVTALAAVRGFIWFIDYQSRPNPIRGAKRR